MSEIVVPRGAMVDCSFIVNDRVGYLEGRGVSFRSDRAMDVALQTIQIAIPQLIEIYGGPAVVEAEGLFQWHDGEAQHFTSGSFEGVLARVSLERIMKTETSEGLDTSLEYTEYDLGLVFIQRIVNPDPAPLGYSDEILVPLRGIETLRSAA